MNKKLRDLVIESSQVDLINKLEEIIKNNKAITNWIDDNIERNTKRVVLVNLLASCSDYLNIMKLSLDSHISIMALCTRSIYEINIRVRSILENSKEMDMWQSEAITDKIQVVEGVLLFADTQSNINNVNILRGEIERLHNLVKKYNLPIVTNPASTGNLAKKVGQGDEHKALFKLYSKLVHPSSFLVNDYHSAASVENKKILQIHAQLYSYDTAHKISEELNVPRELNQNNLVC